MHKTAVYLRVSTNDQEKGLESQEHAIQKYLKGHGIKGAMWLRDRISGAKDKRPGLDRLDRAIFNGEVKTVIVWKLDRLSRGGVLKGLQLLGKWLEAGVRVVSITEQFDFHGAMGELQAAFCFAVARMFRDNLRENTKRGMRAAKDRGAKLGKRPKLFAKDIVPLLQAGMSMAEVARKLNKSRQAVYNALKREGVDLTTVAG